jgi:hypothetical protein
MRQTIIDRKTWIVAGLIVLLSLAWPDPAAAERRVALVIGNSAYQNVARLDNPRNDARLMAKTLAELGFSLVGGGAQLDLDKASLDKAVQSFGRQIQGADVTLFYYAGHGVQVNGANYLVPVDANATREADVDFQMLEIGKVLNQMQGSGTRLNMVILDACRNNPFGGRGLRSAEGGLAQMRAPDGTLISYATQPGSVAQDGANGHSPFTEALAKTIREPGLDIFQTFNEVGLIVKRATGGSQQPWVSSSPIDGKFYFVAPAALPGPQAAVTPPPLAKTLRPDPDRLPMTPTGEATEGLLMRLRKLNDLKPWGSIVYGPENEKYGISWDYATRREAVAAARANCDPAKCAKELSFYGTKCGAFAISAKSWSLIQRDTIQRAKDTALDECAKAGKACRIVAAVCADGAGR